MTLNEWHEQMLKALAAFVADVKRGQEKEPDVWPVEAEAGDWDEWFLTHDGAEH